MLLAATSCLPTPASACICMLQPLTCQQGAATEAEAMSSMPAALQREE